MQLTLSNVNYSRLLYKIAMGLVWFYACASFATEPVLPKGLITIPVKPAPALVLKDMDGKPFDLGSHKGQWVFVHFWATWCGPCRREMPTIQKLAEAISADQTLAEKILIVPVNTAEDDDKVFSFLGIVAPDLNPLMDYDGLTTERWQPRGIPSTFLIDPQGRQRYLALGGRDWVDAQYLAFIKKLLASQ